MQQSGTKGLYPHTDDFLEDEEVDEEVDLSTQLRQHLRTSDSPVVKRVVYKMSDEGVLLPEILGFTEDEVKMLLDSDFVYNETTTKDDLQEMKDFIKEQKVLKLAEILEIENEKAKELFEFLKSLQNTKQAYYKPTFFIYNIKYYKGVVEI